MFINKFRKYYLNCGDSLVSAGLPPNIAIDGLYFRPTGVVLLHISSLTQKTGNHTHFLCLRLTLSFSFVCGKWAEMEKRIIDDLEVGKEEIGDKNHLKNSMRKESNMSLNNDPFFNYNCRKQDI